MKKNNIYIFILLLTLIVPMVSIAQSSIPILNAINGDIDRSANQLGYNTNSEKNAITVILLWLNYLLGLFGVLFLVLIIFNGIKWMTAGGNEENVKIAKSGLTKVAKGFAIVLFAYIIVNFALPTILKIFTQ